MNILINNHMRHFLFGFIWWLFASLFNNRLKIKRLTKNSFQIWNFNWVKWEKKTFNQTKETEDKVFLCLSLKRKSFRLIIKGDRSCLTCMRHFTFIILTSQTKFYKVHFSGKPKSHLYIYTSKFTLSLSPTYSPTNPHLFCNIIEILVKQ